MSKTKAQEYENTNPKQLGDLYERMQFVMQELQKQPYNVSNQLWHGIFDLETEVKHYEPQRPPFARRSIEENERRGD